MKVALHAFLGLMLGCCLTVTIARGQDNAKPGLEYKFEKANKLYFGKGVKRDYPQAYALYEQVYEECKCSAALYMMGNMLYRGQGVSKDQERAVALWEQGVGDPYAPSGGQTPVPYAGPSAAQGIRGAQPDSRMQVDRMLQTERKFSPYIAHVLGQAYMKGEGCIQDHRLAYDYFYKGAQEGYVYCIYDVGYCYYKGLGVDQDYNKARSCFEEASDQGYLGGTYFLALCYHYGHGVKIDTKKARALMQVVSEKGYEHLSMDQLMSSKNHWYLLADKYLEDPSKMPKESSIILRELTNKEMKIKGAIAAITQTSPQAQLDSLLRNAYVGNWEGKLLTLDWSAQKITGTMPVRLAVRDSGKYVYTQWHKKKNKRMVDMYGWLMGDALRLNREDTLNLQESTIKVREATLQQHRSASDTPYLTGKLAMYSHSDNTYAKPLYAVLLPGNAKLTALQADTVDYGRGAYLSAYPNGDKLKVEFELLSKQQVNIEVLDWIAGGNVVLQQPLGELSKGKHSEKIDLQLTPGVYMLRIQGAEDTEQAWLVKE